MNTQIIDNVNRKNSDLTRFLQSNEDGVFYTGHASILVRLNNKKYLFDFINNTNFYSNSWIFFPNQIMDNRLYDIDGIFVSHIHQDHYDPVLLRKIQKKNIPIFILDGRDSFKKVLTVQSKATLILCGIDIIVSFTSFNIFLNMFVNSKSVNFF